MIYKIHTVSHNNQNPTRILQNITNVKTISKTIYQFMLIKQHMNKKVEKKMLCFNLTCDDLMGKSS